MDTCGAYPHCGRGNGCCCALNNALYVSHTGCNFCCSVVNVGCNADTFWSTLDKTLPYGCYKGTKLL